MEQLIQYGETGELPKDCTKEEILEATKEFATKDYGPAGEMENPFIYMLLMEIIAGIERAWEREKENMN